MIYLIGGPPRTGKSTLARTLRERDGLSGINTDIVVSMLAHAAPQLGVHHGTHDHKADSAHPFVTELLRAAGADGSDFVLEGDVVTPAVASEVAGRGQPVAAVFLGHTALSVEELRIAPHWLEGAPPEEYQRIAAWVRERSRVLRAGCEAAGQVYVEMADGREEGLARARRVLISTPPSRSSARCASRGERQAVSWKCQT